MSCGGEFLAGVDHAFGHAENREAGFGSEYHCGAAIISLDRFLDGVGRHLDGEGVGELVRCLGHGHVGDGAASSQQANQRQHQQQPAEPARNLCIFGVHSQSPLFESQAQA